MIRYYVFFLVFLTAQICLAQSKKFEDAITDYVNCRNCYFLAVNVQSSAYNGEVVVENDDLFDFFHQTKGYDKNQYKEFARKLMSHTETLHLDKARIDKSGLFLDVKGANKSAFRIVKDFKKVDQIVAKGCVSFLRFYFLGAALESLGNSSLDDCGDFINSHQKDLLLVGNIATSEQNAIISKLFQWQIPSFIDAYSGSLSIGRINFKREISGKK